MVVVTFLPGCSRVVVGSAVSLEEARLQGLSPGKVLVRFQVCLVTGQRWPKNRVCRGLGPGAAAGLLAESEDSLLSVSHESWTRGLLGPSSSTSVY